LHSRTQDVQDLLRYPAAWRPNAQKTRLEEAIKLRRLVNENHLPACMSLISVRTMTSLVQEIAREPATGWAS
jgi:hypothetical protein